MSAAQQPGEPRDQAHPDGRDGSSGPETDRDDRWTAGPSSSDPNSAGRDAADENAADPGAADEDTADQDAADQDTAVQDTANGGEADQDRTDREEAQREEEAAGRSAGTDRDEIDHRSSDESQREASETGEPDRTLGLVADPDMPERVARYLAEELPELLGDTHTWRVEVDVDPVTAGRRNTRDILRSTRERMNQHDWDYAICLTDLPVRANRRPVLADANIDERVGVVSLPTLGGTQPYRRSRQVVLQLMDELNHDDDGAENRHGLDSKLTELVAPIHRESREQDGEVDVRYSATRTRGRARLLSGMVRTNQPWRLVFGLRSALAAALATSAFGLSSSTIWQIGDLLGTTRQVIASLASIAVLVFWLITAHGLWERRQRNSERDPEQVLLYNTSTVLTLTIGVSVMYAGLFVINLLVALFLVPTNLLTSTLGHAEFSVYVSLAWGFTTMGVVAGALGSSLESDQAVRQAAYGYREEQRRGERRREG
ncbi:5,10-methylene-tetrahydrofolate dehydrogenase [Saccharopolyspora sp. SCSIO 74807]|uniref:5,10-methylene-tetrahydrofolate dehydrogenase n=1 Tax=Saccharopolyspora sp. SCSIO 74807 TaxID=3118084 RepID=UPI0030CB828B